MLNLKKNYKQVSKKLIKEMKLFKNYKMILKIKNQN